MENFELKEGMKELTDIYEQIENLEVKATDLLVNKIKEILKPSKFIKYNTFKLEGELNTGLIMNCDGLVGGDIVYQDDSNKHKFEKQQAYLIQIDTLIEEYEDKLRVPFSTLCLFESS
jgi:deoxyribodipyrimidine photolyase-like uncharacterized protein